MIKIIVKKLFKQFGLDISKLNNKQVGKLEWLMLGVLSSLGKLNIVQIGANDGVINDPIYDFVMQYKEFTKVLLIEPLSEVIPYLTNNYSRHPDKIIFNGAIGEKDELTLYSIKKDFRSKYLPTYAKGWPTYRASTGITSSKKSHLVKHLKDYNEKLTNPEEYIETITVPCMRLENLINKVNYGGHVDMLQVDAEGADDLVIYNSSINIYKPKIINYESGHLSLTNNGKLKKYLANNGYIFLGNDSHNTLAVYLYEQ